MDVDLRRETIQRLANFKRRCFLGQNSLVEMHIERNGGRHQHPQPPPQSLFEWGLTLEQEREADPVGLCA